MITARLNLTGDGCYRFAHLIRDFAWRKNNIKVQTESENGFIILKMQVGI